MMSTATLHRTVICEPTPVNSSSDLPRHHAEALEALHLVVRPDVGPRKITKVSVVIPIFNEATTVQTIVSLVVMLCS